MIWWVLGILCAAAFAGWLNYCLASANHLGEEACSGTDD